MTNAFRRLDDALIDRVFQPLVARLPDADPQHWASLCYAGLAGVALARMDREQVPGLLATLPVGADR